MNHYWTKSEDIHRAKWAKRRSDTGKFRDPLPDAYLELLNRERDETIQMYVPALTEAIRRRERGAHTREVALDRRKNDD